MQIGHELKKKKKKSILFCAQSQAQYFMNMDIVTEVLNYINKCRLPKLRRNLEECDSHPEFELWEKNLTISFTELNDLLPSLNLYEKSNNSTVIASLMILYYELRSDRWQSVKVKDCLKLLNLQFNLLYDISLETLLTYENNKIFNTQEVFDKTIELLHIQLTVDDFKKYPVLIDVYQVIIKNLKEYPVTLKPTSLLPISLILIDDFVVENKIKGLQCCSSILECLTPEHFQVGNYYEVINGVLEKSITEKDVKVLELVLDCFLKLFKSIPSNAKLIMIDDKIHIILEQLYIETNLYKKKSLFCFINKLIPMHGVNCVKEKRMFLIVICDNLDISSNPSVGEILLEDVIECLENWISYCWCVWRLHPNMRLLSLLIRNMYIYCEQEKISTRLQNILITLFKLCTVDEHKQIHDYLINQIRDNKFKECFLMKLDIMKNELNTASDKN